MKRPGKMPGSRGGVAKVDILRKDVFDREHVVRRVDEPVDVGWW